MNYALISENVMESPEYLGCNPIQQATWHKLLWFCCKRENGGTIEGCGTWKNRKWEQVARVTRAEIEEECDLWHFDGNSLLVRFYPTFQEEHVRRLRKVGKLGGRPPKNHQVSKP
jgi:hypothetical protein